MNRGIYPALSGGIAYERLLSVISNNVANLNTSGYKIDRPIFRVDTPSSTQGAASLGNNPHRDKFFTEIDRIFTDFGSGAIKQTGNTLDIAIEGDGFFVVSTPDGQRYTRSGAFTLNSSNTLTTMDGHMVMGESGPIVLGEGSVVIDPEGGVSVNGTEINRLKIVDFDKPYNLQKDNNNMFKGTGEKPAEGYSVVQGAIELSNVNPVKEMAAMIEVLRGYESYRKVMTTIDETTARANEIGRT